MVYYTQKKNFDQLLTWDFLCSQNATNQSKSVVKRTTCALVNNKVLRIVGPGFIEAK